MLAQILEAIMLVCFGLSWPINALNSYRARTAIGTSPYFLTLITSGYLAGIGAKISSGSINWVLAVYVLNLALLVANWAIYFRNRYLDEKRVDTASSDLPA